MSEATSSPTTQPAAFALAVDDQAIAHDVMRRLEADNRRPVVTLDDPARLVENPSHPLGETTLVSYQVMRQLSKHHAEQLAEYGRNSNLVLLIRSNEFLDSVSFLEHAGGVVFMDATADRMGEILDLSKSGYSILPSGAVMDIVTDRLRCDQISRLNMLELSILDQVRLAKTNRAIARTLGLSEANVKTKVRAILKSLKFQNRTEAAVFAARQNELIRSQIIQRSRSKTAGEETAENGGEETGEDLSENTGEQDTRPH